MAAAPPVRTVELGDRGTLVIRPAERGDIEGLTSLFERLDDESRYRRFFSMYRPDAAFIERMVRATTRDGVCLVAEVTEQGDHPPARHIVGEAGYEKLPNRDGELAITIDRRWRGWLGPFLLDALVEAAAGRGVPNLEAEVLMTNRPMLALLRSRGHASMPTDDWTVARSMIGAETATPTWPGERTRVRVLVEGSGGRWSGAEAAVAAGMEVLACPGPAGRRSRCPALDGRPCPLAAGADVIVVSHPTDDDQWKVVRCAHATLHHGVPVCVELSPGDHALPSETVPDRSEGTLVTVQRVLGPR